MDFSDWLMMKLNEKGLTQSELARAAGIDRQVINNYINGRRKSPKPDNLVKIAKVLGVSIEEIFNAANISLPISWDDNEYEKRILQKLRDLPRDKLEQIEDIIDAFREQEMRRNTSKFHSTPPSRKEKPARSALKNR